MVFNREAYFVNETKRQFLKGVGFDSPQLAFTDSDDVYWFSRYMLVLMGNPVENDTGVRPEVDPMDAVVNPVIGSWAGDAVRVVVRTPPRRDEPVNLWDGFTDIGREVHGVTMAYMALMDYNIMDKIRFLVQMEFNLPHSYLKISKEDAKRLLQLTDEDIAKRTRPFVENGVPSREFITTYSAFAARLQYVNKWSSLLLLWEDRREELGLKRQRTNAALLDLVSAAYELNKNSVDDL